MRPWVTMQVGVRCRWLCIHSLVPQKSIGISANFKGYLYRTARVTPCLPLLSALLSALPGTT